MKEPIVLRVYRGERLIAVKQFLSPQIVIGRQSDSGLSLDDESVAPIHAVIEQRGDDFFLSDLGSESGVTIEGTKVLESKIEDGECVGIGPYSVRFYIGVPKPPVPPDYSKPHTPPVKETRTIEETKVSELDLDDKDEFPDLPLSPEGEVTLSDEVSLEAPMTEKPLGENVSAAFVDMSSDDDSTHPEINTPVEVTSPGVHIATRDVDETIDAQKTEPVSGGYLAPESNYSKIEDIIDPHSRGSVLEVVVAWKERILKTYHFSNKHEIYMSNTPDGDIYVPIGGAKFKHKLVTFADECVVNIATSMEAQLYYDNKVDSVENLASQSAMISPNAGGAELKLDQGQMVRLNALGETVCIYIRFVEDTPKAATSPVFDFTSSEAIGIFMSIATIVVLAMYMLFYVPGTLDNTEDLLEDRLKRAVITFNPPPRIAKVDVPKVEPTPIVKPRETIVTEEKAAPKKVEEKVKKGNPKPENIKTASQPDKPKSAAPSRVKGKGAGSSRPGGSVNTGEKAANMETKKKDLSKTGILGILSGGGQQDVVDKVSSGAGATIGMADQKTGFQGQESDQKGDGIGTKLQKPGAGGSGSSLAGVGGLKTSGRGGNQNAYGAGGLGGKDNVSIVGVDGIGDDFRSSIDKDAIRRLIQKNKNAIKGCYDRALSRNKSISGKVVLSWKIAAGGKMISPRVKSTSLNNSDIEQCIINRLMVLKFPEPGAGEIALVDYPFVFKAPN